MNTQTPTGFRPDGYMLLWLVAESPRFDMLFGQVRRGRASVADIVTLLWPATDPDQPHLYLDNLSPSQFVRELLLHEATPCAKGGSGLAQYDGCDFMFEGFTSAKRPECLPRWPSN